MFLGRFIYSSHTRACKPRSWFVKAQDCPLVSEKYPAFVLPSCYNIPDMFNSHDVICRRLWKHAYSNMQILWRNAARCVLMQVHSCCWRSPKYNFWPLDPYFLLCCHCNSKYFAVMVCVRIHVIIGILSYRPFLPAFLVEQNKSGKGIEQYRLFLMLIRKLIWIWELLLISSWITIK